MNCIKVSCSVSKTPIAEQGSIEGMIYVTGNEPFTKLAVRTSDDKTYILKCTQEIEKELITKQGYHFKIHYEKVEQSSEGWTVTVTGIQMK